MCLLEMRKLKNCLKNIFIGNENAKELPQKHLNAVKEKIDLLKRNIKVMAWQKPNRLNIAYVTLSIKTGLIFRKTKRK